MRPEALLNRNAGWAERSASVRPDRAGAVPAESRQPGDCRGGCRGTIGHLDRLLLDAVQEGLPLVSRPYAELGRRVGLSEAEVLARLARWSEAGIIKRHGVIVRHRPLGYRANAMVVWDVPDEAVGEAGRRMSGFAFVTLCYRRPRRGEDWPYNLFCMIHGKDRTVVEAQVAVLAEACGLADRPRAVLFSRRCFKQRGARYRRESP
jgi:DNA-binding Lrp family transcriptional regulator